MSRSDDLRADLETLGKSLGHVLASLDDYDSKLNGADAAAIVTERRMICAELVDIDPSFDQVTLLRADYDMLEDALDMSQGGSAATVARCRRVMSAILEQIEQPGEVSRVDELAARRANSRNPRIAARRRKSG